MRNINERMASRVAPNPTRQRGSQEEPGSRRGHWGRVRVNVAASLRCRRKAGESRNDVDLGVIHQPPPPPPPHRGVEGADQQGEHVVPRSTLLSSHPPAPRVALASDETLRPSTAGARHRFVGV
ncbi:unnamed protein product [Lampetra fluviatilis]